MKIGFYAGRLISKDIGGGSVFQQNFIECLKKYPSNHEIVVYYISDNDIFESDKNVTFVNLNYVNKANKEIKKKKFLLRLFPQNRKNNKYLITFNDVIKKDKIDLVYYMTLSREKVDAPYVMTIWDLAQREHPYFPEVSYEGWTFDSREEFYAYYIPRASRVVIGNNEGKNQVCKYYNANEDLVKTIPMPTPEYVYYTKENNDILSKFSLEKNKFLLYPAQFWAHKNHIRLIKEFSKLKQEKYDFKLVFTGSDKGNIEYIKEKAKELNIEKDVIFAGFVTEQELVALYKNAYALTFAAYFGPDNIPPLEAMALGCPVICSDFKGAREQLKDCALYFNPTTGENFNENIKKLEDDSFKNSLIQKGEVLAKEYCSENYIKKVYEIIDDFVGIRECWE